MPFMGRPYVRKPLVWGRTAKLLQDDIKGRVASVELVSGDMECLVRLNEGWHSDGEHRRAFLSWEHARNWVRKAVRVEEMADASQ